MDEYLRRLTWAALERKALEANVPLPVIRRVPTRADLIRAIEIHRGHVESDTGCPAEAT